MPVVRRGDRNRVDRVILEQAADILVGARAAPHFPAALAEDRVVNIAERGNLDVWHAREGVEVILPTTLEADDRDAHAIVSAEDALRSSEERDTAERTRAGCGLEKIPARHI